MHPSLEYALVGLIAAIGCYLCTPLARLLATRWGAVARPRDRDVHAVDTPRLGGMALLAGFGLAMLIAHALPTLHATFRNGSEISGVLWGGLIICALGVLDDRYELDSLTKFAGQVTTAAVMSIVGGIQLLYVYVPWGNVGTIPLDRDASVELTILLTVLTINAINFIDGLDGLAAGVTAIQGLAFFGYSYHLAVVGNTDIALAPTLICAGLVGVCVGFLPHNFANARIFMGDSGSMLVGLLLSAAATTASSQADPQSLGMGIKGALPLYLPLILPLAVLALPLGDLALAVIRRLRRGQSPFAPDKEHLHHRLMDLGHSHRRAVLLLYFWSAVVAFGAVAMSVSKGPWLVLAVVAALFAVGVLAAAVPRLRAARL
ncbi:MAG: glycosyltransferase family 4 protein [Jatrophihabitans sp.]